MYPALRRRPGLSCALIALIGLSTTDVHAADDPIRLRNVERPSGVGIELLSPRLRVVLAAASSRRAAGIRVAAGMGPSQADIDLPDQAMLKLSRGVLTTSYWHIDPQGHQVITTLDESGEHLWEAVQPWYQPFYTLGTAGYVVLPRGSNRIAAPQLDLEFHAPDGSVAGVYADANARLYTLRVHDSGRVGIIVGSQDQQGSNQFILLSPTGAVLATSDLLDSFGLRSQAGLSLSKANAAFVAFPGIGPEPSLEPIERKLYLVSEEGATTMLDFGDECGTHTAWLDEQRVALLGADKICIWDRGVNAWLLRDFKMPGETFLPEMDLDGDVAITVARVAGVIHVIGVDLAAGHIVLNQALPADAELAQDRRTIFRDSEGVSIVTKRKHYRVEVGP